ncbi:aldolase [Neobacillus notoginsengisoli]|uniref:Aldolase n=1 Tax=Neobacillus notoginsengisoli TaxID=1578198 RepID=A0A417YYK1_9BACI|nr:transaldolase family protein [Neobacillus notoginsengisoli]RHW42839.1 aldolase [Neobacillus notoginsengisoli]
MKYLIDSANYTEIDQALRVGAAGVTANPSLYLKENVSFYDFLKDYHDKNILLTAEVIADDDEDLVRQAEKVIEISKDIVIKLNYSAASLKFARLMQEKGIKTAITLVFDINQAMMAINAGADYLFLFVARNEEIGVDGLELIRNISRIVESKGYHTKLVAASIRTKYQLESATLFADYIAVPYRLMEETFHHPLTVSGADRFADDMKKVLDTGEALAP